jgi:hypothetical protein
MPQVILTDNFSDPRRRGKVIGSRTKEGAIRSGIDVERVLSIDNDSLRIGMLAKPGWGRAGVAYGPIRRQAGTAFATLVVNGHNNSQSYDLSRLRNQIARWVYGVQGIDPVWRRLVRWPIRTSREGFLRRLECWWRSHQRCAPHVPLLDNLAIGLFPNQVPADPAREGHAFIMRAASQQNGALRCRVGANGMTVSRSIQDLPIWYGVILRDEGAAYYTASLPRAHAMTTYPAMRPVGIDPFGDEPELYAGIHQGVLGEMGFMANTRARAVRVAQLPAIAKWYGTAHLADALGGQGPLEQSDCEIGGPWRSICSSFQRTINGARAIAGRSIIVAHGPAPSGLIHVLIETDAEAPTAGLAWRVRDGENLWVATVGSEGWQIQICDNGAWTTVASNSSPALRPTMLSSLQVLDDGRTFRVALDGAPLQVDPIVDDRHANATGAGIVAEASDRGARFRNFEAHARSVPIPAELDVGPPWFERGNHDIAADDFVGPPGDLAGRRTSSGGLTWARTLGRGMIELAAGQNSGAKVRASVGAPNPGRTIYTIPWLHPDFAELEVEITFPGTARGQREKGRSGFAFWQDPNNYIIVNLYLDDRPNGPTVSSFFYLNGHEDLFDAVFTRIGNRVVWGRPCRFRVVFDGLNYLAWVDDEPLLSRSLVDVYPSANRLAINRVGLCVNWEWGNDTGTLFRSFAARSNVKEPA